MPKGKSAPLPPRISKRNTGAKKPVPVQTTGTKIGSSSGKKKGY